MVVACTALLVAGCSGSGVGSGVNAAGAGTTTAGSSGVASSAPTATTAPDVTSAAPSSTLFTGYPPTTVMLPPRPRSFDLTTVDPCALMPPERRNGFGLDQPPIGPTRDGNYIQCSISSSRGAGLGIFLDTGRGAASKLTRASTRGPVLDRFMVNGFLVTSVAGGNPASCIGVADTGDGQTLEVQVIASVFDRERPRPCELVRQRMPVIMDSLAAMQP